MGLAALVDRCLQASLDFKSRRSCMHGLDLDFISPSQLAEWICSSGHGAQKEALAAEAVLLGRPALEFLGFIDEVQSLCEEISQGMLWHSVIMSAEETAPNWVSAVRMEMTPERIFSSESEALVQLAQTFIGAGDEYLLAVLEDGGRGFLGGSPEQTDRAAMIACDLRPEGEPYVSYLESLIDSPETTSGIGMGCTLAHYLTASKAQMDGDSSRALEALNRALDDERFRLSAAAQLLADHTDEPVPAGFDKSGWAALMHRASPILRQKR